MENEKVNSLTMIRPVLVRCIYVKYEHVCTFPISKFYQISNSFDPIQIYLNKTLQGFLSFLKIILRFVPQKYISGALGY